LNENSLSIHSSIEFRITQQESVCQSTKSINYKDLSKTEIAKYNSMKSQILDI